MKTSRTKQEFGTEDMTQTREATTLKGISIRAFLISVMSIILFAWIIEYAEYTGLRRTISTSIAPLPPALITVLALVIFNFLVMMFLDGRFRLTRAELATIFCLVSVGGMVLSWGLMAYLPGTIAGMAAVEFMKPREIGPILKSLPDWLIVKDRKVVDGFMFSAERVRLDGVPWGAWVLPSLMWIGFYAVLFFMMLAIGTLVRRRWTDHENLRYPVTTPVMELLNTQSSSDGIVSNLTDIRAVGAAAIVFVLAMMTTIKSAVWPWFPAVPDCLWLGSLFTEPPWNAVADWPYAQLRFHPFVIGLSYIVPLDTLFSLWFFGWSIKGIQVLMNIGGVFEGTSGINMFFYRWTGIGVYIAIAVYLLWMIRGFLWSIVRDTFTSSNTLPDDSNEPLSYKLAFWGTLISFVVVLAFFRFVLGTNVLPVFLTLVVILSTALSFARVRAVTGIPTNVGRPVGIDWFMNSYGWENIGMRTAVIQGGYLMSMAYGTFTTNQALVLESYKIADEAGLSRRSLTRGILAIFIIASVVGLGFALRTTYEWGFANCPEAVRIKAAQEWSFTGPTNVPEANWRLFAFSGVGVVIGIIMMVLKSMFIWWPFDPVAMGVAYSNEWVYWYAASFFVTWLIKAGALRYGGAKTYKDLYPIFLGMAAGYILYVAVISIFNLPGGWSVASMA